jgi:hypothetical protein
VDDKINNLDGVEIEFTRDDACAWPWPKVTDPVLGHPFRANELVKKLFGDRERVTAVDVRTWLADVSSAKVDDIPFQTDFSDLRKHLNLRVDVIGTAAELIGGRIDADIPQRNAPRPIEERLKYSERQFLKNARFGDTYGTTPASMLKWLEEKIGPEEAKKIQESWKSSFPLMTGTPGISEEQADVVYREHKEQIQRLQMEAMTDPSISDEQAKAIKDDWRAMFPMIAVGASGYPDANRGGGDFSYAKVARHVGRQCGKSETIRRLIDQSITHLPAPDSPRSQGKSRYLDKFADAVEKLGYKAKRTLSNSPRTQAGVDIVSRVIIPASIPIADVRRLMEETHDMTDGSPTIRTVGDEHVILTAEVAGQIKALWEQDAQRLLASKHTGPVKAIRGPSFFDAFDFYEQDTGSKTYRSSGPTNIKASYSQPDDPAFTEVAPKVGAKADLKGYTVDTTPFVVQAMREELAATMRTLPADKVRKLASFVEQLLKEG